VGEVAGSRILRIISEKRIDVDSCCCDVLVVLVDDEVLGIWCLGGRGAMLSALAIGLRGGVDPVTCSTLGWSVILGLDRVLRGDVSSGLMRV